METFSNYKFSSNILAHHNANGTHPIFIFPIVLNGSQCKLDTPDIYFSSTEYFVEENCV